MSLHQRFDAWVRRHRDSLWGAWGLLGAAVLVALAWFCPDVYYIRGIAPWPRGWIILFFLSLWGWIGLRFIARWIWAWVVMAWAPVFLFVPIRFYLDAWWLLPLLIAVAGLCALTVGVVVARGLRRRRVAGP
jgi:hypothetical protein